MNDEVALAEIFWVKDPELGEESLLDSEGDVSEYSANSSESEDEIETTKESESLDESMSDVSEDVAVGDGNRRGQNLCRRNIVRAAHGIGRGTHGCERGVFGTHGVARS